MNETFEQFQTRMAHSQTDTELLAYRLLVENKALKAQLTAMQKVVDAADLKRNSLWRSDKVFEGEWTVIPTEDFDKLYRAVKALKGVKMKFDIKPLSE